MHGISQGFLAELRGVWCSISLSGYLISVISVSVIWGDFMLLIIGRMDSSNHAEM